LRGRYPLVDATYQPVYTAETLTEEPSERKHSAPRFKQVVEAMLARCPGECGGI
jgi:hypothetical protein